MGPHALGSRQDQGLYPLGVPACGPGPGYPVCPQRLRLRLRLLLDRYSAELFVEDGQQAASMVLYPPENADGITFRADAPVELSVEKYDLQIPDNWRAAK